MKSNMLIVVGLSLVDILASGVVNAQDPQAASPISPEPASVTTADDQSVAAAKGEEGSAAGGAGSAPETVPTVPVSATQDPPETDEAARSSKSRVIEQIVVTAQKREERLQDVPISISAFSPEALAAQGVENTEELVNVIPGMTNTEAFGYNFTYIRGIGTDAFVPSVDPSVPTYVDGIFVPTSQGFITDFGGIERVEVLKGPQGTLFGRNTVGGAISIVTRAPGDEYAASLTADVGNYNTRNIKGYISGPITDWLSASLDFFQKRKDSQYKGVYFDAIPAKNTAGRARVLLRPLDDLKIDLTYYRSKQSATGLVSKNTQPSALFDAALTTYDFATPGQDTLADDYTAYGTIPPLIRGHMWVKSGTVTWELPWFDVKAIGSDQYVISPYTAYDFDGTELPITSFQGDDQFTDAQTGELQLISRPDGILGEWFDWVIGGYYVKTKAGYGGVDLYAGPQVGEHPHLVSIIGVESISAYSQVTWHATDWLDLTAGARYQNEERKMLESTTGVAQGMPGERPTNYVPAIFWPLDSDKTTNLSPKLVVSVKPRDGLMIYASRTEGFKSGTFNLVNIYLPPSYVEPEEIITYEVGVKSDFFDGNLRLNGAIFDNRIKNKQVGTVSLLAGGAVALSNADKARIKGVEFDVVTSPMPSLDPGLAVTLNASYLDAYYPSYTNGQGYNDIGVFTNNADYTGNRIERTPRWSGSIGLTQAIDVLTNGQVEANINARYQSKIYYSAANNNSFSEAAYTLVNAQLGYIYLPWRLRATFYGNNIFDKRYHASLDITDYGVMSTLAYKRQYGFTLNWDF